MTSINEDDIKSLIQFATDQGWGEPDVMKAATRLDYALAKGKPFKCSCGRTVFSNPNCRDYECTSCGAWYESK